MSMHVCTVLTRYTAYKVGKGVINFRLQATFNGIARTLKKLRTSKRLLEQAVFLLIASLFIMGTFLKGMNLLPQGANPFL